MAGDPRRRIWPRRKHRHCQDRAQEASQPSWLLELPPHFEKLRLARPDPFDRCVTLWTIWSQFLFLERSRRKLPIWHTSSFGIGPHSLEISRPSTDSSRMTQPGAWLRGHGYHPHSGVSGSGGGRVCENQNPTLLRLGRRIPARTSTTIWTARSSPPMGTLYGSSSSGAWLAGGANGASTR